MSAYDSRRVMLDSGLTALALRALHERDGHYPFMDRFAARRRSRSGHPGGPVIHPVSRWERASQWCGLWSRFVVALLAPGLRTSPREVVPPSR